MGNKTTIRIISIADHGRNHDMFCNRILMLRKARKSGDVETVNNTVLGALRRNPNEVKFEII